MNGDVATNRSGNGHPLRAPQFQHRLHILPKEWRLNSQFIGQISIDDARHALIDMAQPQIGVAHLAQINDTHRQHLGLSPHNAQHTIAHDIGSGVDAQNDFLALVAHLHC